MFASCADLRAATEALQPISADLAEMAELVERMCECDVCGRRLPRLSRHLAPRMGSTPEART
jgi:hypothetical protein